eukprot:9479946-Pyramimonas_sp.AAC.1
MVLSIIHTPIRHGARRTFINPAGLITGFGHWGMLGEAGSAHAGSLAAFILEGYSRRTLTREGPTTGEQNARRRRALVVSQIR